MILVLNVCRERLHFYEFVKPVLDILKNEDVSYKHYLDLSLEDLERCDRVIICGTSLMDNSYLDDLDKFNWLKNFKKPVLGICAGFQIISLVRVIGMLKKKKEIGFFKERFEREFLGVKGEVEVYHLHGNIIDFSKIKAGLEFVVGSDDIIQAIKFLNFYGVLFHPEVRNKEMILEFCRI